MKSSTRTTPWPLALVFIASATFAACDASNNGPQASDSGADGALSSMSPWRTDFFLKATNTGANDFFGGALALSADGNTLAVGAHEEDSSGSGVSGTQNENSLGSGAVYVYVRSGNAWTFQAFLKSNSPGEGDLFGKSLALSADGNTLVVGAPNEDSSTAGENENSSNSGAAYVYTRNNGTWTFQAFLKANNADEEDRFGNHIALSADGNLIAVSAEMEDGFGTGVGVDGVVNDDAPNSGAVYLYSREGNDWPLQAFVKASNTGAQDRFGSALALSANGKTLAVGAIGEDSSGFGVEGVQDENSPHSGAVYIYARDHEDWTFQTFLKASNTRSLDSFGQSLALSADGNVLAVGAPGADGTGSVRSEDELRTGAAYLYARTNDQWTFQTLLAASNPEADDAFGSFIALSTDGRTLAVAATGEDSASLGINGTHDNDASDSGAVYLYTHDTGPWESHAFVKASNTGEGDSFCVVALSSDGRTLAVGAPNEDSSGVGANSVQNNNAANSGAVYVYSRN